MTNVIHIGGTAIENPDLQFIARLILVTVDGKAALIDKVLRYSAAIRSTTESRRQFIEALVSLRQIYESISLEQKHIADLEPGEISVEQLAANGSMLLALISAEICAIQLMQKLASGALLEAGHG